MCLPAELTGDGFSQIGKSNQPFDPQDRFFPSFARKPKDTNNLPVFKESIKKLWEFGSFFLPKRQNYWETWRPADEESESTFMRPLANTSPEPAFRGGGCQLINHYTKKEIHHTCTDIHSGIEMGVSNFPVSGHPQTRFHK